MIHRFWTGPARQGEDYRPTLEEFHDEPVTDWTPETLPAELQPLCECTPDPRRTSNLVRYALLARFGGLWVDHDVEALACLTDSPTPWTASLGTQRSGCVMWFPTPQHPMMLEALRYTLPTPEVVSTRILALVGNTHPEVGREPRVLPLDISGRPTGIREPLAIHHWETSSRQG